MLKYKIVKQRNALDKDRKVIYYPRLTKRYKYTLRDVAREISDRTSLSRGDIMSVLVSLEDIIPDILTNAGSVDLGELGTFSIQAHADIADDPEEVTWRSFKSIKAKFRPGAALKLNISQVKFRKVQEKSKD